MFERNFDHPLRELNVTKSVYGGENLNKKIRDLIREKYPETSEYNVYFGELHGHTNLSDAQTNIDSYFRVLRDAARLDFCALTDHDHGGPGKAELWGKKWELIQEKVREYNEPGKFVTILGYERDSYPFYNNLVLYYKEDTGKMIRGEQDGEITEEELRELLNREDIIAIPHTTTTIVSGTDFNALPLDLMTSLIEVYSKWGTSEYFENPDPVKEQIEGGFWRDALEKGAKMGCIAASDTHGFVPGIIAKYGEKHKNLHYDEPGVTAVLTKELTREAIFEAIQKKRCYGLRGCRMNIDFRINGQVMGSDFKLEKGSKKDIYFKIVAREELKKITLVKNGRNYVIFTPEKDIREFEYLFYDYRSERETDYYYLRVEEEGNGRAWTSPIWINNI